MKPSKEEIDLMFNIFKKGKISEKIYNEVLDEVFQVLDTFDEYLKNSFQKEDHEPYGKGYDIAIERIRENYFYTKDNIKYLLNRRKVG